MRSNPPEIDKGYFFRRFIVVSLLSLVILLTVFVLGVKLLVNQQLIDVKAEQKEKATLGKNLLEHILDEAVLDLRIMTDSKIFKTFMTESESTNPYRSQFNDLMVDLMKEKANYYQIRFLDSLGRETFRIDRLNGEPHICSKETLQDKSDRYYYTEAIGLHKGEIYISPFDLNVEHQEIETPFRPMIRICIPVFAEGDNAIGVNVLNFDGTRMLKELNVESSMGLGDIYLINQDGYFLHAPNAALEWGFMFPDKQDATTDSFFTNDFTDIAEIESGQFESDNGLFTIETVNPFAKLGEHVFECVHPKDYSWKIVSFIPRSQLSWADFVPLGRLGFLFSGVLAAAIILAYLYSNVSVRKKLALQELTESEENLRIANQTKDRFFSMLSHDLKNASGTIAFYLDFTNEQDETFTEGERKMHLNDVTQAAMQHNKLLYEILDWAKLQQGRTEINPQNISVGQMLEEQKSLVELALKKKEIELKVDMDEKMELWGDLEMVKTVFRNLINNAIKFSHRNSCILLVGRRKAEQIEIRVVDTGIGMREKDAAKILDLDSKIQQRGTDDEGGTGFGLKMVSELVAKNNGHIKVESELGKGSSFIVSFPSGEK